MRALTVIGKLAGFMLGVALMFLAAVYLIAVLFCPCAYYASIGG